jgi:hypothetical protein
MTEICPPRIERCPVTGELDTYYCGRLLLERDPTNPDEACPGGTYLCVHCFEDAGEFLQKAYDARAVRQEWEGG